MRRTSQLGLDLFQKTPIATISKLLDFAEPPQEPPNCGALPLTVVFLLAALCDGAELEDIQEMSKEELEMRYEDTRIHVTARCAWLLEVSVPKGSITIS